MEFSLAEIVETIIVMGASLYSACISKRVEKAINRINGLQVYNKNRKNIAKELNEVKIFIEDKNLDLTDITQFSKIQGAMAKVELHSDLLTRKEIRKLKKTMKLIKLDEIAIKERKIIIQNFNYFIEKLMKGDIII